MRIHGRKINPDGTKTWVTYDTAAGDPIDAIYVVWLIQALKMNTLESPFWPGWGVDIWQSLQNTFYPDSSIANMQAEFSQYFSFLSITRQSDPDPHYAVSVITKAGVPLNYRVAVQ